MAKRIQSLEQSINQLADLSKAQLIVQLHQLQMPKHEIRKIVGVDMNQVTKILKPLRGVKNGKKAIG